MFNIRPPYPWLYVSSEDEERRIPGFNIETPLLGGFIQAANQANREPLLNADQGLWSTGFAAIPGFNVPVPPSVADDPSETAPPSGDYEIQVPPGLGGSIVDGPPSPAPAPLPDPPWPTPEEDDPELEPAPSPSPPLPLPSPLPLPRPPQPHGDWLAEALARIAGIYGNPRQASPELSRPPVPVPVPQPWPTSETWSDSRTNAGEAMPSIRGFDPRFIVQAVNTGGTSDPPRTPPDERWRSSGAPPPADHNGPPGPVPNDLSEVERPTPQAPARPKQPPHVPKLPVRTWPQLFLELLRHMPLEQAVDLLWQWEHESQFELHLKRIGPTVRIPGGVSPDVTDLPPGLPERLGVRLSPALPAPVTPSGYTPKTPNQQKGAVGEFHLANRAAKGIPGEKVIYYGVPGGTTGADIISVGKNGTISVWDSKWRGSVRSITQLMRGYQTKKALEQLVEQVRRQVWDAYLRGDLKDVDALKALKNASDGNFFINTIGTGEAQGGVVQQVVNGEPGAIRRLPR